MSNITVRDLKRILEHANDDDVVVIAARGNGGVGPQSVVPLGSARSGRDWDRGHFILSAPREMSLRLETEEDKRAHRFYAQCVDSWACHQPPLGDGTMKNFCIKQGPFKWWTENAASCTTLICFHHRPERFISSESKCQLTIYPTTTHHRLRRRPG